MHSPEQQWRSILHRIGKALQRHDDGNKTEPLPRRWVDLIHRLNELERGRNSEPKPPRKH
jgi:hypothetical protein